MKEGTIVEVFLRLQVIRTVIMVIEPTWGSIQLERREKTEIPMGGSDR